MSEHVVDEFTDVKNRVHYGTEKKAYATMEIKGHCRKIIDTEVNAEDCKAEGKRDELRNKKKDFETERMVMKKDVQVFKHI